MSLYNIDAQLGKLLGADHCSEEGDNAKLWDTEEGGEVVYRGWCGLQGVVLFTGGGAVYGWWCCLRVVVLFTGGGAVYRGWCCLLGMVLFTGGSAVYGW